MNEYLVYADLQHLSLESLSFDKKLVKALFRHKINKNLAVGIEYNRINGTTIVSYPQNVSASEIVVRDLELCMKKVLENLEKQLEVGNVKT